MEAQKVRATWVVLDRQACCIWCSSAFFCFSDISFLGFPNPCSPAFFPFCSQLKKEEGKYCMEQLQCNLVIVKRFDAKILRLNLRASSENARNVPKNQTLTSTSATTTTTIVAATSGEEALLQREALSNHVSSIHGKITYSISEEATSSSSPEVRTPFTATDKGTSSASSSEPGTSPHTSGKAVNTCTDHTDGDALIIETDSASDYGLVDAPSGDESSSDESCAGIIARHPVCRTANASPERRSKGSIVRYFRPSDLMPQPYSLTNGKISSPCL